MTEFLPLDSACEAPDQATCFGGIMEAIWEGGKGYDLTWGDGQRAHDANALGAVLFPEPWAKKYRAETEHGVHYIVDFPDGSQLLVYEAGDGIEYL